jgi:hypothetical protein
LGLKEGAGQKKMKASFGIFKYIPFVEIEFSKV